MKEAIAFSCGCVRGHQEGLVSSSTAGMNDVVDKLVHKYEQLVPSGTAQYESPLLADNLGYADWHMDSDEGGSSDSGREDGRRGCRVHSFLKTSL